MSELLQVWSNDQLTGATPPPPFSIPNNPNAKSLKINNQSKYWLLISKTNGSIDVDRIEPFSFLVIPFQPDLSISIDTKNGVAPTSSLIADHEFVDYSTINGILGYQKGSTQFNGAQTVDVNSAQITMTATNVTINNGGSHAFNDASGQTAAAGTAQTVLNAASSRSYLFFQNLSDTDMYVSLTGTATAGGAGSIWVQQYGGAIEFESSIIPTNALSVICSKSGKAFTCYYV